ncbi:MAG: HNH endonuclease [Anaerolineae bacterium]|nr:HNH endonuclease [Anaerolineae bacterium]MCB0256615.1 HNH endonuclease [Anaerolineae bacterium]MCO5244930.1 HNH endonuclease [Anaerolineae bacterium]
MASKRISAEHQDRIRRQADNRCGYCQSHQKYVMGRLEIDHLIPRSKGGSNDEENLWLSCRLCNNAKRDQTHGVDPLTREVMPLYNPRTQAWSDHFIWSDDGVQIIGLTPCGRATVLALQLNNLIAVMVRQEWVAAGWHPPAG